MCESLTRKMLCILFRNGSHESQSQLSLWSPITFVLSCCPGDLIFEWPVLDNLSLLMSCGVWKGSNFRSRLLSGVCWGWGSLMIRWAKRRKQICPKITEQMVKVCHTKFKLYTDTIQFPQYLLMKICIQWRRGCRYAAYLCYWKWFGVFCLITIRSKLQF